ncbi:MAG: transcriptional regulator [Planctomycetes bacterium]|nr:transcriptional regulator [Planctomycetota bacterium]
MRSKIGMSTEQLAERIGKSPSTISRIENGKQKATIELVTLIAKVLNTHPFSLLTDRFDSNMPQISPNALSMPLETKRENCLGRMIEAARLRSRLSLAEAAREIGVAEIELQMYEEGKAIPTQEALDCIATLYPLDMDTLMGIAYIAANYPGLERRIGMMEGLLSVFHCCLRQNPEGITNYQWAEIANEVESVIGLFDPEIRGAERPAEYFSIGHISDQLLTALQDPQFHSQVEKMAEDYARTLEKPRESQPRQRNDIST